MIDSEIVTITVTNTNRAPVLAAIGDQSVTEGALLSFGTSASDPDGDIPTLTSSTLPTGATYTDNGDGTGGFSWTPTYLQSGSYSVTFYATDDLGSIDSELVTITVIEAGNQDPVLAPIGAKSTTEGVLLSFIVSATDAESTPSLSTSTLPSGATFVDNGDGTGEFNWTPTYVQSGSYNVTFFATDDSSSIDGEQVTITVNEAGNQDPVLAAIGPQSTTEDLNLTFGVSATDAESTPSLTSSTLPAGASFTDNGDGTGSFDWTPDFTQAGTYDVTFFATDDSAAVDSEVVTITVNEAGNRLPVLAAIGDQSTTENVNLSFGVSATDAESTPSLTTSSLPAGAGFTDNGDGTGSFSWTPTYLQSGSYPVTFYATDDSLAVDSELVTITVIEAGNQDPVLAAIGPQSTDENTLLSFGVSATDIEDIPGLTTSALPSGASFVDNGDGTGSFDWTPTYTQAGTYDVTFYATDDSVAVDSEIVTITVNEVGNQLPTLDPIGAKSTDENVLLTFAVSSSDAESTPSLTTSTLPTGASFIDNGDGTGSFDWTPTYTQAGIYNVTFYATDDSAAVDSEIVAITVNEVGNQLPTLDPIGSQSTTEDVLLSFGVSASDEESTPSLTTSALPTGAAFVDNGDGTGSFDWTPDFTQAGTYNVTFYATDDSSAVDSEIVTITVNDAGNQPPVLDPIGDKNVDENVLLTFGVSSSDADGTTPALTTSTLPSGASFTDNGDGTGSFDWTPTYLQAGSYPVTFYADDGIAIDSELVTITVNEVGNQLPVLAPVGDQSTTEGINLAFGVSATDIESTPSLTTSSLPIGASFIDNGDGTGSFDWTPEFVQAGTYPITFYATDDSLAVDSELVTITVNEAGNQTPVLDPIGAKSVAEGVNLNFAVTAVDPDSTIPTLLTSSLPSGASFTDNGDGTGTFDWTPTFLQSGEYVVLFRATDGTAADSEFVTITVNETGNQAPVLDPIGDQTGVEDQLLTFGVTASDGESTPSLTTSTLPTGASFTDNGDGTGSFVWTPTFQQAGTYPVTFYATDDSLAVDSELVTITINDAGNQAPVLDPIGDQSTTEDVLLSIGVSASDADGTIPSLTTSALPTGASFTDNGDGTGSFSWTPTFTQSGTYDVTFYASDGSATDSEVVTITVLDAGNQPPVLDPIGDKSVDENVLLTFGVSASDADETFPLLSTSTLPTGASFVDNGDGTGTFSWTPTYVQAGSYPITFYAEDVIETDSELVTITVNEVGNQLPVLASIGAQSTTENINLTFGVSATDAESTPTLTTSTLPSGASFTDNGDGTGSFDWTPTYLQSGVYNVTFYATDDSSAVDSEQVAITVNEAGNQLPVLDPIGDQATTEEVQLLFAVTASDVESTPSLTTSTLPSGATFVDNGDGSGSFDWTPTFTQSGTYDVTFYATDDSSAVDSELVTITVNDAGNQTPVLDPIGAQSTTENVLLTFAVTASDADATTPSLTTSTLPSGASFVDNGDGSGSFSWTPTFLQSGSYDVTFYASDGTAIDSEIVTITVIEAGNQLPVLDPIGAQATTEEVQLLFAVTASDVESTPSLTTSTLPSGATFVDNGDGSGSFDWTPTFTQSGTYDVTFYATDDSSAVDSELVTITVNEAGNQTPVLDPIGAQSTTENVLLTFGVSSSDPDGTTPALTTSTLPSGASFADNGDGTGSFDWTPTFLQSGSYEVTFYASDGTAIDSEIVTITVIDAGNQLPVLSSIGDQSTTEEVLLSFGVSATDAESTPSLSTSTLPSGASFVDNGDGTGSFDWTPTFTQAGTYNVTFYATDDSTAVDSEQVVITVFDAGNQPPVLDPIGAQSINENVLLTFGVSASDADGTIAALTTSTLPTGASFTDNGDGTGSFSWTPTYIQAGSYNVTFFADDGVANDSEIVTITVNEVGNQLPVLAAIGDQSTTEGINLAFGVSATDAESTPVLTTSSLPIGASFIDNGDGTGSFDWTPEFVQAGTYPITFYATDDSLAVDSEQVTITVLEAGNQTPVLDPIGPRSILEGANLNIAVSATDADSTIPSLFTSALPTGASFTDNGDGTGTFDWTPSFTQSGEYVILFRATDGAAADSEFVTITVNEAGNQPPVLDPIGDKSVTENTLLAFSVTSSDPDETTPVLSTSTLPSGALFIDNGDGTGNFSWTPDNLQAGTYPVTFYADDGLASDSEQITITVLDAGNQTPVLDPIGPKAVDENVLLTFGVTASDPDATIPSLTTSTLPSGASFVDNGDGSGTFSWTPTYVQSGSYDVTFYADDGVLSDSEVVTITVNEVGNQLPVLAAIGDQSTTEGINLAFGVSATDAESTPSLSTSTLPIGASFIDNGDGTGSFDWTPEFVQAGTYPITFYATDDSLAIDSELVTITVLEAGNQPPVLDSIGSKSTLEGANLNFGVSAVDPDSTIPSLATSSLPTGATFVDNGDGTGAFDWTPSFTQDGSYVVLFIASDGTASDSEFVTITVNDAGNQPPVLDPIGAQSTTENVLLAFGVSATDPDATTPVLTTSTLPTGALFIDNGDGTGNFSWTPDYLQSGSYSVTFYANDGVAIDSEVVTITVNDAGNQPPVLDPIGPQATTEEVQLLFGVSASDIESIPNLTTSTLPTGATFTDNGDGTGSFDWTPTFTQAGSYDVTFYATDDSLAVDSEVVTITVNDAGNQAPVLDPIGAQSTDENVLLTFVVSGSDPDGTTPTLLTSTLPSGATFIDNGDGTGTFSWTPTYVQSGAYDVTFYADDGTLSDSEIVTITVIDAGNQTPVLDPIGDQSTTENINLLVGVTASDPESVPSLTTSTLPTGASFTDNGDGTGSLSWTPTYVQSGSYPVTFYATDDSLAVDSEQVTITVLDAGNQPPVLDSIGDQSTTEEVQLLFGVFASDVEGDIPSLTTSTLPTGAAFTDNGDGTGSFDWTPTFTQAGTYDVTFYATDDSLAVDSEVVTITVNDAGNQAPVLDPIGPKSVDENALLAFTITGSDPDATTPFFTASGLPTGATLTDNNDGSADFAWTPDFDQAGVYDVTFFANDGTASDSEIVTITVNNVNRAPVADAGPDQFGVPVGSVVTLDGSGSFDPDVQPLNYTWVQVSGTSVTLSDSTASQPTFSTTLTGIYEFELTVDDNSLSSAPDTVAIEIVNVASPQAVTDLSIQIVGDAIELSWSPVTQDVDGFSTSIGHYVIYRGTKAWFVPTPSDSIGGTNDITTLFSDNNIGGADVVGDTINQHFYTIEAVDIFGNRSTPSNRVGEYDYQLVTTSTTNFNLVSVPFANTGITTADDLIAAIGTANVNTVNRYIASSQNYEARFAAGFGSNFSVTVGGIYQVNAAANSIFSVAGSVPDTGAVSFNIITTSTTDYNFLMIPFEYEDTFATAQNVLDHIPGVLNTLNNYVAGSQSYVSRFSAGFGTDFPVKAGKPYQGNAATSGTFPGP